MNTANNDVLDSFESLMDKTGSSKAIKCIVWDLDDTLWDGTLIENDQLSLKPGIVALLDALDQRGILHSIASKNNHSDAMAKLQEFGIDHYFLYPQIGWNAKSKALADIQKSLNIGMDTLLFVDDQAFERDEVEAAHPSIRCVSAEHYIFLPDHPHLNPKIITADARNRRLMYVGDMQRQKEEESFSGTPEAFLATLDMTFIISLAQPEDLSRAEELTLRTNQLNSTGVTYDRSELESFMHSENHQLLVCELCDNYGSYGKIGLALIERQAGCDLIKLMLMSCRTLSRGVGSVLLTYLMKQAALEGKALRADFKRTDRNRQMLVTYQLANFREIDRREDGQILFENKLEFIQEFPNYLKVVTPILFNANFS